MFTADAAPELRERYNMDPRVWAASQRNSFPHNVNLSTIVLVAVGLPLITYFIPFGIEKPSEHNILLITIAVSIIAYYISNNLIMTFKDVLCAKGKFGKDLNKLGDQATKEKV